MRSKLKKAFPLIALFISLLFPASNLQAQDQQPTTIELSARAGFDGYYKSENWVPVYITTSNQGDPIEGQLQIVIEDAFGGEEILYSSRISLPTQSNKRLIQYVRLDDISNPITVALVDDSESTIESTETNRLHWLGQDDLLYGVVTPEPGKLDILESVKNRQSEARVAYLGIVDLPEQPAAWNAFDVMIFHDVDTSRLTIGQLNALEDWVSVGGQVVFTGGANWRQTTAAVAHILPVEIAGLVSAPDLPSLMSLSGIPFRDPGPYLVSEGHLLSGEALVQDSDLLLLSKTNLGRGNVFFLALDPYFPPLADWDGSVAVWRLVVAQMQGLPEWATGFTNGYAAFAALSALPPLSLPSAIKLFLFVLIYILVIGPINYLILKRIERREIAWVTIPGLVILFTVIAIVAGFRLKGNEAIVNQLSVAFGQIDGDRLRVQSLLGLYSPKRTTYELSVPSDVLLKPFDGNSGDLSKGGDVETIQGAESVTLTGVRVDVGEMQPFISESYQEAPAINGRAVLRSEGKDLLLDIAIENKSDTRLENAVALLGLNAIPLGTLEPGSNLSISEPFSTALNSAFGSGMSISSMPTGPSTSPLALNYETILGNSTYYDDPESYAKWQLLEAIMAGYGSPNSSTVPGKVTLIAWSDEEQIDVELSDSGHASMATTLYFLEITLEQTIVSGHDVTVPKGLLNWNVLGEEGVYNATIYDLYFPPGWVEFEFQPWPEFQNMDIDQLGIVMQKREELSTQPKPKVQLWDWQQEVWAEVDGISWGQNTVEDVIPYIGPANTVRLHLQNDNPESIEILEIYPALSGILK